MPLLDVTRAIEEIIADIVSKIDELSHIDPARLIVSLSSTRSGGVGGTYARIHPLRFPGGGLSTIVTRNGVRYRCTMPSLTHRGVDALYLITFLVPRFLNLTPREKLATIIHELYHISPSFDGDIRRFPGRNYAHGSSRKRYNDRIAQLATAYLERPGSREILSPIAPLLVELKARHRTIVGRRVPTPKIRMERES